MPPPQQHQNLEGSENGVSDPLLVTLGMCILDDLYLPNSTSQLGIVGGSGVFCIVGARLFLPSKGKLSKKLAWIIRAGDNFPENVESELRGWETDLEIRKTEGQEVSCTRGELRYESVDGKVDMKYAHLRSPAKIYKYISGPYRILPSHLSVRQLSSSTYHFLTSPLDTAVQVPELLKRREEVGILEKPLIMWEPIPLACNSGELENLLEVLEMRQVGLWSPNHVELGKFWGEKLDEGKFTRQRVESLAGKVREDIGKRGKGNRMDMEMIIVVRCGEEGCCVWSRKEKRWVWIEAFHRDGSKVIDATGAGNAFLGGFAVGWKGSGGDEVVGCVVGSVAAGVICEGLGAPKLDLREDGDESWNGLVSRERLEEYWARLRETGVVDGSLENQWCLERV
ncbi:pfkB family kinase protein [Rutstroemia sp. NJR-2017a BBW]|nr:pfkB family kinase protein [Rutstroemia sp. NJR-2017a BBW]